MQSREDSLWESFPWAILTRDGAGRYINTFQAPFQELPPLSQQEVYALRACSLLVIPPPAWRAAPQGGFPTDLTEINLSGWAALVQDVAAGLQARPPGLSHGLGPQVVALLQLLEVAIGVGFCHHCRNLEPHCRCMGVPQSTLPTSWSQFMEQTLGYGVTPSSSGVTAPSTSRGGMSGCVPPPPGIPIWDMPPLEDAVPPGPVTILPYRPPTGRTGWLRSVMSVRGIVPQTPQMPTPIRQLPLLPQSRQATPYQQLVQLPGKTSGLGVTFDSSASSLPPLTVGTLMYVGDRLPEAEMMAIGLPATPEENERGPLSGRPTCRCLTRRVDTS